MLLIGLNSNAIVFAGHTRCKPSNVVCGQLYDTYVANWSKLKCNILCWSHRSYCRFCCAMAHLRLSEYPSYLQQLCPMGGHSG